MQQHQQRSTSRNTHETDVPIRTSTIRSSHVAVVASRRVTISVGKATATRAMAETISGASGRDNRPIETVCSWPPTSQCGRVWRPRDESYAPGGAAEANLHRLLAAQPYLRLNSSITRMGSSRRARATSRNSITSKRRSPFSNLDTNDWGRPSFFDREAWVSPARRRASVNNVRKCRYLRLNADFGTSAVCNPESDYPKLGYAL
jgi:hypothetical protein